jgi:hypothetical protein
MPSRRRNGTHRAERLFEHHIAGAALAPSALEAAMPKPARRRVGATSDVRRYFGDKSKAFLSPERLAEQPFVFDGNGRIIAPWPRHAR